METRDLLVVDAFADELLSGVRVALLPDGSSLTDRQLRAIAGEVGAPAAVAYRDGMMRHVPRIGHGTPVAAAVAGCVGLAERDALDRLGSVSPAPGAVADLLGEDDRLFAFTFDTLTAETDVHARVFEPDDKGELAASGVGAAGCARFLATRDAFDGEQDTIRVESGQFLDRPATLEATLDTGAVSGRGLLSLAGTVNVPPDDEDDIVVA